MTRMTGITWVTETTRVSGKTGMTRMTGITGVTEKTRVTGMNGTLG